MMNSLYRIRTEEELGNGELNFGGGGRLEKKERLPIESCSSGGGGMSKYATSHKNKEIFIELVH